MQQLHALRILGTIMMVLCLGVPAGADPTPTAANLLSQYERAWNALTGYHDTVTIFERKTLEKTHANAAEMRVFEYEFRKPSTVAMHIVSGRDAGAYLYWDGGPTVLGKKGAGILGIFSRRFSLHDAEVTTIRGSSIDELSFGSILTHLQAYRHDVTAGSPVQFGNSTVDVLVLMPQANEPDFGLNREVVFLDEKTHLPVEVLGSADATVVRKVDFANTKAENSP